jgi:hypothetical protein
LTVSTGAVEQRLSVPLVIAIDRKIDPEPVTNQRYHATTDDPVGFYNVRSGAFRIASELPQCAVDDYVFVESFIRPNVRTMSQPHRSIMGATSRA